MTCRQLESCATYATLIPIVLGIMLSTRGEASFVLLGFVFCVLSTLMRSLKSVLQSLLLAADESYRLDSINLLRSVSSAAPRREACTFVCVYRGVKSVYTCVCVKADSWHRWP